jgi:hypothetical protein
MDEPLVFETLALPTDVALVAGDRAWHEVAQTAYAQGDLYEAKRILLQLLLGYRRSRTLAQQLEAVTTRLDRAQEGARAAMSELSPVVLPAQPNAFRLLRAAVLPSRPVPKVALKSNVANKITDDEDWHRDRPLTEYSLPPRDMLVQLRINFRDAEHDQTLGRMTMTTLLREASHPLFLPEKFPTWVPPNFGTNPLARLVRSEAFDLAFYGQNFLLVFDAAHTLVRGFDTFSMQFPTSHLKRAGVKVGEITVEQDGERQTSALTVRDNGPQHDVRWAQVRDGVLYLSTSHNGYAKETGGMSSWITGVDMATGDVLFRSDPLTANSQNFVFWGSAILCGYGFTAEPRAFYVLDASNGRTLQKITLPTSPEAFVPKYEKNQVDVRGYNRDFVFSVESSKQVP